MTTPPRQQWQRVSRGQPCPICGKPDWCLMIGQPPEAAICARIESPRRAGEAGWLHHLRDSGPTWSPRALRIERSAARLVTATIDFARMAAEFRAAVRPEALARLAFSLGLSVESLHRLGIGWSAGNRAWAFPMSDTSGTPLGIRLRLPRGRKLSVRGGREGLFLPGDLAGGKRLLICEGPTDTAALLDLGFAAVGRPSCTGGVQLLKDLVQRWVPPEVILVADDDEPGRRGAERLAKALVAYCRSLRLIMPPDGIKDARAWKIAGATPEDIEAVITAAPIRSLAIIIECKEARKRQGSWKSIRKTG